MKKQDFYWIIIILIGMWFYFSLFPNDEVKLGDDYIYDVAHRHILGPIDIPPVVNSYKYNKRLIVAKQSPRVFDEVIYDKMAYDYYLGRDTAYYWIIDKQTGKVYGPVDDNKYILLLGTLNAPEDFYNLENNE